MKQKRKEKSKTMRHKYVKNIHRWILFTDKKIFTVKESFYKQNDEQNILTSLLYYSRELGRDQKWYFLKNAFERIVHHLFTFVNAIHRLFFLKATHSLTPNVLTNWIPIEVS